MQQDTSTWLQQTADLEVQQNRHWAALDSALTLAAADGERAHANPMWRAAMSECRQFADIRIGVGPAPGAVAERFLAHRGWRRCLQMRELFAAYVEAGLIDPKVLRTASDLACSPLEWAVMFSNVDALRSYLDAGSDPTVVPTPALRQSGSIFSHDFDLMPGIDQLIEQTSTNPTTCSEMLAALTQWRMERQIDDVDQLHCCPSPHGSLMQQRVQCEAATAPASAMPTRSRGA